MKAAFYTRVSTERQENENTIESQTSDLEVLAKESQYTIIDRYSDNGYSGSLLARPELDRLRDDAAKGLFEVLLIHSPDRLARKYVYQELVIEELKNKGVMVVFKNRRIAETPEDQLLLGVQGIVAEYERAKIVERTRRGRLHRAKSNHIIGNIPPYGYRCIPKLLSETGFAHYVINEEEAKNVRLIFDLLATGHMTTYGIIRELNRRNIKPRKGDRWARSTVNKICRNETYQGTTYYNKHYGVPSQNQSGPNGEVKYHRRKNSSTRLRGKEEWIAIRNVPQIVEKATFLRAQQQLDLNFKLSDRNTKHHYLLKGFLKCGNDQKSIYGIPAHGKQYYRCSNKSKLNSDSGCITPTIGASILDPLVWSSITGFLDNPAVILQQYTQRLQKRNKELTSSTSKSKQIESSLTKLKNEENRILLAYSQGVITLLQFKDQNLRIIQERNRLDEELTDLKSLAENNLVKTDLSRSEIKKLLRSFRTTLENLDFDKKRSVLKNIIKEIEVNTNRVYVRGYIPLASNETLKTQPPYEGTAWCREDAPLTCIRLNSARAYKR